MINSKITQTVASMTREYPYLGESRSNNSVVLFSSPQIGMVIRSGTGSYNIGHYYDGWNEHAFDVTEDTVHLSNKRE